MRRSKTSTPILEAPRWSIVPATADRNPEAVIACTLGSSGLNFEEPWGLVGMPVP